MVKRFKFKDKVKFTEYGYEQSRRGYGSIWEKTSRDTIFTVTNTDCHVNCIAFGIEFGNNRGLRIEDGWFVTISQYGCKHSCPDCNKKCDYWESA